jgi:hypothetical protein
LPQTEKLLPCPVCRAEKGVQFVAAELAEAKPDRISCFSGVFWSPHVPVAVGPHP